MKKPKAEMPLSFSSAEERAKWLMDNAEYFTVIQRKDMRNHRHEFPTLTQAEKEAGRMAETDGGNFMIYAVGPMGYSTYVKTIKGR